MEENQKGNLHSYTYEFAELHLTKRYYIVIRRIAGKVLTLQIPRIYIPLYVIRRLLRELEDRDESLLVKIHEWKEYRRKMKGQYNGKE